MYDYNITIQELSDYYADMAEMAGEVYFPTDEEMEEMDEYYEKKKHKKKQKKKNKKNTWQTAEQVL